MFASADDVSAVLMRPLTGPEGVAVAAHLRGAESMVRLRIVDVDERVAASPAYADLLRHVVQSVVARVLRNPDGKVSEQIDDYRYQRTEASASGSVTFTDEDWATLEAAPGVGVSSGGAFTVRPWGRRVC